jgi:hypothetical protein
MDFVTAARAPGDPLDQRARRGGARRRAAARGGAR